jgi:hypothetical protein
MTTLKLFFNNINVPCICVFVEKLYSQQLTFQSKTMSQGDEKEEIRICVSGTDGSDDSLHSSCEERLKPVVEHDSSDSDPSSSPEPQPKQGRAKCSFLITDILAETYK